MISHSFCAEDVVLQRCFDGTDSGFYIDVGANHHQSGSVTKHFYDRGWSGINVEPQPDLFALLERHRPRDTNVCTCCSSAPGEAVLSRVVNESGLSTVDRTIAEQYENDDKSMENLQVNLRTLDSILEELAISKPIDFVTIDVEGHEGEVLAGFDLQRWQPSVLVVEATAPYTNRLVSDEWEPGILAAGYKRTLFDGVNLFFVRADLPALIEKLSYPANPMDDFVPARFASAVQFVDETQSLGKAALTAAKGVQLAVNAVKHGATILSRPKKASA